MNDLRRVLAILTLVTSSVASAQPARPALQAPEDVVVLSRRSVAISLPLDTSTATLGASEPGWHVRIGKLGENHSLILWLTFDESFTPAAYRAARRPTSCRALTSAHSCREAATIQVADGRLVITVRDSAMLALLFADRPTKVAIASSLRLHLTREATVRYVDPQFVPASRNALAEHDRALGRDGWSPWTRIVRIGSPYGATDTVLMHVGDTTAARVTEEQSVPVDAINYRTDFTVSGWTTSDSSVVAIRPANGAPFDTRLVALRAGRASITVHGLRGPSDELPRSPRTRTITRHIIVTNRLARVRISPRPREIVVGAKLELVARAIDVTGGIAEGVPVDFFVIYDVPDPHGWEGKRWDRVADADVATPGRVRFLARFANFADTLDVQVVPRRASPPSR